MSKPAPASREAQPRADGSLGSAEPRAVASFPARDDCPPSVSNGVVPSRRDSGQPASREAEIPGHPVWCAIHAGYFCSCIYVPEGLGGKAKQPALGSREAEIEALRKQVLDARVYAGQLHDDMDSLRQKNEQLLAQLRQAQQAREALKQYVRHHGGCPGFLFDGTGCTCGLDAALTSERL